MVFAEGWPMDVLRQADAEIHQAIVNERRRQQDGLEMIASENYTSPAVMAAQGSVLTNKYAEGYPGRRYYGGCEFVDRVERLAIDRVLKLVVAGASAYPREIDFGQFAQICSDNKALLMVDMAHIAGLDAGGQHGSPVA